MPGPRSSRCRGAAAARSGRRPASSAGSSRSTGTPCAPGSWPPSPGLAPCAILIWMSSALTRYSLVTPNRPEATCLIAERRSRRWPAARTARGPRRPRRCSTWRRAGSSRSPASRAPPGRWSRTTWRRWRTARRSSATGSTCRAAPAGAPRRGSVKSPRSVISRRGLVVDPVGVLAEHVGAALPGRVLEPEDRLGVEQVRLALPAPLVLPADAQTRGAPVRCRSAGRRRRAAVRPPARGPRARRHRACWSSR